MRWTTGSARGLNAEEACPGEAAAATIGGTAAAPGSLVAVIRTGVSSVGTSVVDWIPIR